MINENGDGYGGNEIVGKNIKSLYFCKWRKIERKMKGSKIKWKI